MDADDFARAVGAPLGDPSRAERLFGRQLAYMFRIADRRRVGRVSFDDFCAFDRLVRMPDAEYAVRATRMGVRGSANGWGALMRPYAHPA